MNEFMKAFASLSEELPLSLVIMHVHSGVSRWRIEIFVKDMAIHNGDTCAMEILHVEEIEYQKAFERATQELNGYIRKMQNKEESLCLNNSEK